MAEWSDRFRARQPRPRPQDENLAARGLAPSDGQPAGRQPAPPAPPAAGSEAPPLTRSQRIPAQPQEPAAMAQSASAQPQGIPAQPREPGPQPQATAALAHGPRAARATPLRSRELRTERPQPWFGAGPEAPLAPRFPQGPGSPPPTGPSEPPGEPSAESLDPRIYLRPIWARKWIILAVVAIVTGATYFYYERKPPQYRATAEVYVKESQIDQSLTSGIVIADQQRNTADQAELLTSRPVARSVARKIGFRGDPAALLGSVEAQAQSDTDFVVVNAVQGDPRAAARLANAFAGAFIELRSQALLNTVRVARNGAQAKLRQLPDTPANKSARKLLNGQIRRLNTALSLPAAGAEIANPAVAPGAPFAPRPVRAALFAMVIALLLACGGAFLLELFDRRISDIGDLESAYPFPILGVIPQESFISPLSHGNAHVPPAALESFRSLRTGLDLVNVDQPVETVLVTSALASEGKSSIVRNLALVYREAGKNVAIVEADLRKPTLARVLGVRERPGLTDMLAGHATPEQALQHVATGAPGADALGTLEAPAHSGNGSRSDTGTLSVITAGPHASNPPAVLGSGRVHELIEELQRAYDVVLIDTPPLLSVSDAVPLLSAVDAVVVVSRLELTTRAAARRACALIQMVPEARIGGVVVNDVATARMVETGFEYYYYGPKPA